MHPDTNSLSFKSVLRTTFLALVALSLVACASTNKKVALLPEVKQSIKHIAIIEVAEPKLYSMNPGSIGVAGAGLYAFGALGGAILGGIEVARFNAATSKFTAAVSPYKPEICATMINQLEQGLIQKGYQVTRIPAPPKTPDGKRYDFKKVGDSFDAILDISIIAGGYSAESDGVTPKVIATVTMQDKVGSKTIFTETYAYSSFKNDKMNHTFPEAGYKFGTVDAACADGKLASEGMKMGAAKIAERIAADL